MTYRLTKLTGRQILDSRGRPTLEVDLELAGGAKGVAAVPSGASTGSREAVERRDRNPARYRGEGVMSVITTVEGELADGIVDRAWGSLADLDAALCALDGTPDKARLGANAIVGVSMAVARALAVRDGVELYRRLAPPGVEGRLPVPHFNVINGGVHAKNRLDLQEFMVAPIGAPNFREALRAGVEVHAALRDVIGNLGFATGLGDEGGFAPALQAPEDALDLILQAIEAAGYQTRPTGVAIALDLAASEFRESDGRYGVNGTRFETEDLVDYIDHLVERYPIWSVEDGVGEDDDKGWELLTQRLGHWVQLVGDDNFVTNPAIITDAISHRVANAALIKVNQVGTVTETLEAADRCRQAGYGVMVSHRSGETTDPSIADLGVALGCGQIKAGAPARGERVAKYNRLLAIEALEPDMAYGLPQRP